MLIETILVAAITVENLSNYDLEKYYWDCDTAFMMQRMSGQDFNSCIAITEMFQYKVFKNDKDSFMDYWYKNHLHEWNKRGFINNKLL